MKTKHEIIDIIASSYTSRTRATNEDSGGNACIYLSSDGNKCAVSMFLTEDALKVAQSCIGDVRSLEVHLQNNGFKILDSALVEDVRGHSIDFWEYLQYFHDDPNCWCSDGLSSYGKNHVIYLKERYA